jgi:hypothetical protein
MESLIGFHRGGISFIFFFFRTMDKYCKNCKYHHNAKHPVTSKLAYAYNDWCTLHSKKASHVVGHCKLKGTKIETQSRVV